MVPGILLCGPVKRMLGPVKCGSKLVLDQYKLEFCLTLEELL